MSKAFVAGLVTALALLLVVGVGASRLRRQSAEEAAFQNELPDATPVQVGVLTERQRIHSKLFTHYKVTSAGQRSVTDLVAGLPSGKIAWTTLLPGLGPELEPESPEKYFGDLAKSSDVVIRGRVKGKVSQITEDGAFLFTDYKISVSQIVRDNPVAPLYIGGDVIVTWPGGKVLLRGVIVKAVDQNFGLPSVNSRDLVLFLRYIPETGAYRAAAPNGAFDLEGSSVRPLTNAALPPGVLGKTDSFIQMLSAISRAN
jgi:hypothetical protein